MKKSIFIAVAMIGNIELMYNHKAPCKDVILFFKPEID